MDREQIIRMAQKAGFDPHDMSADFSCNLIDIERFAALVAEHERAACAALCDEREEIFQKYYTKGLPALCAAAIRARSEK
jgi:hypothetical protein